ncbi:HNH endonuclease signature motif containing protein [Pseudomonas sp. C5pp]|uniref:HNH endonuclease signature motif containing protein n=1 Tax=Pseudomonas sp. C5pp TaxID=1586081 RepID=UPI00137922EC|nr:HNH endonuclease signature motif containing protein [Pseudomonas sp. C5pp]
MAKNKMRRCFVAILDPHPSRAEVTALWDYFQSSCAYCGVLLDRLSRNGHMDHILSSAMGGSNDIHNHLLACAVCNGDEKRDEEWSSFLARKVADSELAADRHARISAWIERAEIGNGLDPSVRSQAETIIAEALNDFDAAVQKLRALRQATDE